MKKDLTKIVNDLLWAADDVCLDNSKDPVDCSSAMLISFVVP